MMDHQSYQSEEHLFDAKMTKESAFPHAKIVSKRQKAISNKEDSGSDTETDQESMFLFSSSLKVGSNFLQLIVVDDDPTSDVVLIGPDIESDNQEDYCGFFGLKNVTSEGINPSNNTIVAFYAFSNFSVGGEENYNIHPK